MVILLRRVLPKTNKKFKIILQYCLSFLKYKKDRFLISVFFKEDLAFKFLYADHSYNLRTASFCQKLTFSNSFSFLT